MGVFLFFAAVMAGLAATTLLWQGTVLDRAWTLNPTAYKQLAPLGRKVGIPFLLLAVTLITAGIGGFRRHLWGWRLAVIIIATQRLGDVVNCVKAIGCGAERASSSPVHCFFSFAAQNENHVCLELLSQKFKRAITDKRGCDGNSKIGSRENIS